jgi:hypothetical protein
MSFRLIPVAAAVLAVAAPAHALTTINFDNLAAYTTVSNQYAAQGVIFSPNAFTGAGSSNSGADWATNTNMQVVPILPNTDPNYDHGLLGSPALASGMILRAYGNVQPGGWLAEDGDPSFKMTFTTPISSISMVVAGVSPVDELQTRIWVYSGATLLGTVGTQDVSNLTTQQTLSFASNTPITSVAVRPGTYFDYVAVDNISFQPVPEPGTWALMALGLAGVAGIARRRR